MTAKSNPIVKTDNVTEFRPGSPKLSMTIKNRIFQSAVLVWFSIFALVIIYPIIWLGLSGLKSNSDFSLTHGLFQKNGFGVITKPLGMQE